MALGDRKQLERFMTEVEYDDGKELKRYIVVTQPSKLSNYPSVQTFIYLSGRVHNSMVTPHGDISDLPQKDAVIEALMECQHTFVINRVKAGRYEDTYINKMVHNLLSEKTLEQVIIEYLTYAKNKQETSEK